MTDRWETMKAGRVEVGDTVRVRDNEITVARVEHGFLGREGMIAFIEDSPSRWLKIPVIEDTEVEVRRSA